MEVVIVVVLYKRCWKKYTGKHLFPIVNKGVGEYIHVNPENSYFL